MEDSGQGADVPEDHDKTCHDIHRGHEGDQLLRDRPQALDAAEDDDGHQHRQDDAKHQVDGGLAGELGVEGHDDGVDGADDVAHLHRVADAEGGQGGEDGEDDRQPLPVLAHAVLDVVHGAAYPVAHRVSLTVLDGQHDFRVLGAHADEGGDPQPEEGARAAQHQGGGDAGDVAGAHRGGLGGGHGLEGGHLPLAGLHLGEDLAAGVLHGVAEFPELETRGHAGEDDARAHQQDQHGKSPHHAVDRTIDTGNGFHNDLSFILEYQKDGSDMRNADGFAGKGRRQIVRMFS